jgi:hypothetical protein
MKNCILILVFFVACCSKKTVVESTENTVSFTTVLHKANATKDGIYLEGFVVDLTYDSIVKLDGKKIRVEGKYTVSEGVNPNDSIVKQGRYGSTKYIHNPKIEILK